MSKAQKTIAKMKKTTGLTNQAFKKLGPKSFKNGVGALVLALYRADGSMTQRELVDVLGMGRKGVKTIVKKAARSELVEIGEVEEKKTYTVTLTEEGKAVVAKRIAVDQDVAEKLLAGLSDEEIEQLNAICDKIVTNAKGLGVKGKRKAAYRHKHHGRKCAKRAGKCCKQHK